MINIPWLENSDNAKYSASKLICIEGLSSWKKMKQIDTNYIIDFSEVIVCDYDIGILVSKSNCITENL